LTDENEVKKFFKQRTMMIKKVADDLRKNLDRIGR